MYLQIPLFKVRVGSSPVWTLTNVGIKFLVTEKELFSLNPIRSGFYIRVNFFSYKKSFGSSLSGGATYNDITVILF